MYNKFMLNHVTIEICIGHLDDAIKAASYPIDRIELNTALELGGLTPSLHTLSYLKQHISTKICCMVRPRGGDFCYTETEYEIMLKDAEEFLKAGADGIVFGFLKQDKTIDLKRTQKMSKLIHSYGKEAVFHKAFDEIEDLDEACQQLIRAGIDRILTSGKAVYPDILKGCKTIHRLHEKYGEFIQFLPGGGVRIENIRDVISVSGSGQVHMTSKKEYPGGYLGLDELQLQAMLQEIEKL